MAVPAAIKDSSEDPTTTSEQQTSTEGMETPSAASASITIERSLRPFKSSEEYLYAMKEDLAEWMHSLYEDLSVDVDNFFEVLETGIVLCRHANHVLIAAKEVPGSKAAPWPRVTFRQSVQPGTFQARDNVSQFISWCRGWLRVKECLLFETDDLVERKNERNVVLCLLEVARRGCDLCDMPAPLLVQMEREIDAEMARDECRAKRHRSPRRPTWLLDAATMTTNTLGVIESSDDGGTGDNGHEADDDRSDGVSENGTRLPYPLPGATGQQIITNDLRSLHQRVAELLNRCTCPAQFPMLRVADGKYRIGDTQVLIFVRVLRNHVMVRVGGGWDTLEHYLEKHDPCRGRCGRRFSASGRGAHGGPARVQAAYQHRPRSCGTPSSSRSSSVPPSPPSRRRSFDLSRLSSPDDCRSSSICSSSRTPSRGSSPRYLDEDTDWPSTVPHPGRRQHSGGEYSSSEVSEESAGAFGQWKSNRQRKSSPRKVMRFGDSVMMDDSEPDQAYHSPPRSFDRFRNGLGSKSTQKTESFGSDDSAVSLKGDEAYAKGKSPSKIPKSSMNPKSAQRRYCSTENISSDRLPSSRSETSLLTSCGNAQFRGRRTSPSTGRSQAPSSRGHMQRSSSGYNVTMAPVAHRRRSLSATRPTYPISPSKTNRSSSAEPDRTASAARPKSTRTLSSSSQQSSPTKPVAPLLEEILHDSELLDTDEKLLKRMERLINEYRVRSRQEDETAECTEDATACCSLSPDEDASSFSTSNSSIAAAHVMSLPLQLSPRKKSRRTVSNTSSASLSAKSPSKIPVFTAWQVKE